MLKQVPLLCVQLKVEPQNRRYIADVVTMLSLLLKWSIGYEYYNNMCVSLWFTGTKLLLIPVSLVHVSLVHG